MITLSGVPDIVVTLAASYIWSGLALWILPSPGGGTAPQMRWLFTGLGEWHWWQLHSADFDGAAASHSGLSSRQTQPHRYSMYAIGSSNVAAGLAGLNVRQAKIASFAVGGAMAALAGLATVAITGTGDPRFSVGAGATLNVAAVVLGGVALTGGSGNVLGVVATAVILIMLNPILTAMGINSNNAQVIQGVLIAGVMMIGGLVTLYREKSA